MTYRRVGDLQEGGWPTGGWVTYRRVGGKNGMNIRFVLEI